MFVYWSLFIVPALLAVGRVRASSFAWFVAWLGVTAVVGLRYRVGGDWSAYERWYQRSGNESLLDELSGTTEPGYQFINWLAYQFDTGVWLPNLISAAIFSAGLVRFVRRLPEPLLGLVIAIPYMVIVLAMGYTRQAVAFGFLLWGLVSLSEGRRLGFVVSMALAVTFHNSAVVLVPLAVLAATRRRLWTAIWAGVAAIVLYATFLSSRTDHLLDTYVISSYSQASQGGPIRVAMNALPAALYLVYQRRFGLSDPQRALWFWISVFALACVPLVFQASTAVDRVALYFMPIQLMVWTHLPRAFPASQRGTLRVGIVVYYAVVQFIWLTFATHASSWRRYQFWPLVAG